MPGEQYSLDNLRDITLPEPPPFWPPSAEVWLLLAIVIAAVSILLYQWQRLRKRNAYRRAGLLLLDGANTVHDVSVILKRVALAAYPREQVASLYGEDWAAFLRQTCKQRDFSPVALAAPGDPTSREVNQLAAAWIGQHRAPVHKEPEG